jgi:hypothetical protein
VLPARPCPFWLFQEIFPARYFPALPLCARQPPKHASAPTPWLWWAIGFNRFLGSHLLGASCRWCNGAQAMDELKAELQVFTWMMAIDAALLLAVLAIVVLRQFG